jgi:hypothetical protein
MSRAKQKGTNAESAVVTYLQQRFPYAQIERRALQGSRDRGDITGLPGIVIEVKADKSYRITEWLKETEQERINDNARLGILVVKPKGIGSANTNKWWAIVPFEVMVDLMKAND